VLLFKVIIFQKEYIRRAVNRIPVIVPVSRIKKKVREISLPTSRWSRMHMRLAWKLYITVPAEKHDFLVNCCRGYEFSVVPLKQTAWTQDLKLSVGLLPIKRPNLKLQTGKRSF
jgi:hypothetical protein